MKNKVLVTGGAGYIGSHTIVDLIENGYEVISIDNLSRGFIEAIEGIYKITGVLIQNYNIDLCDLDKARQVFIEHNDIIGVIHFAAYKAVGESVLDPLKYYSNNLNSLINTLKLVQEHRIPNFVFSSSCSVYGNVTDLPVTEQTPYGIAESPYAHTKQIGEDICRRFVDSSPDTKIILLRYFNPAGAHESGYIGDLMKVPENVVPIITQTAIGIREKMHIYGNDYPTRDGTCIRDYIHVMDIAHAHILALEYSMKECEGNIDTFNLGTGNGVSVQELINAFEDTNQLKLNYTIGPRRPGDVIEIYADNKKAQEILNWQLRYSLEDMMTTAWNWEQKLKK